MSQQVIKKTQEMLGKYITKPPLSEKLLGKPPFRYLHDIVNVVIKDHGFLEGLFTEHELASDNIKEKDAKIAFLQKWIDATSLAVGEELSVRPSKIVAGHEADNTNLLLQAVAKGLDKKVDSSEAVKKVLSKSGKGAKKEKSDSKKEKPSKSKDSKASEKGKSKEKEKEKKESSKTKGSKAEKEKKEKEGKAKTKTKTKTPPPPTPKTKKAEPPEETEKEKDPPTPAPAPASNEAESAVNGEALVNGETHENLENEEQEKDSETVQKTEAADQEKDDFFATGDEAPPAQAQSILPKSAGNLRMDLEKSGMVNGGFLNEPSSNDPVDSGVGSLESPKIIAKGESLPNTAEAKARSPPVPIPPTPGPRPPPLKAYHPDLQEDEGRSSSMGTPVDNHIDEPPERPKTGMSIRPRTGRKSARPPSARPPPPKARERREIPEEELPRPPTGKPVPNVILDSDKNNENLDDDDDNFTVGSTKPILDEETESHVGHPKDPNLEKDKQELLEGDQDAKGILVAQILETKKELEDDRREAFSPETPGHRRVPLEQAFGGDAGRKKEKELIQKDVEKLTSSIQALTRSVNPLAKMLDYLQEDFDSMQKELENWRKENKSLSQNLNAEQSLTDQQLEPLKTQLQEMESAIYDQHDRISAIKAIILRNDEKISRLLGGINVKT